MSIVKNITSVDNLDWREIVINWEGMGDDVTEIKAGTPMDAEGNIANNGNCFGLMMGDVLRTRNRARVVISGPVDLDEAEANSGITLTDDAKAAMRDVWFPGKSGGGLPTGGAAYQQLVTDGEGNAKWEDRLAYASFTERELMPEQTVAFSASEVGPYMAISPVTISMIEGYHYKIKFDGEQYDCVCYGMENGGKYIGNLSASGGSNTGEPFCLLIDGGQYIWISYDTNASHTIFVSVFDENVTPINPKYLPRLNVEISGNDKDGYSSNYTAEEIRSAYYAGKTITGVYIINGNKRILTLKEPSIQGGSFDYFPVVFYEMVSAGDEFSYNVNDCYMYKEYRISSSGVTVYKPTRCLVLSSSTASSKKKFKITVDDSGTISATEV